MPIHITESDKGVANGVAELDGTGKIPAGQLPSIAITNVYVVNDIAERDLLTPNEGDVAKVLDAFENTGDDNGPKTFIYEDTAGWLVLEEGDHPWDLVGTDVFYTEGNVGIGTTTPNNKLTIDGDFNIDGKIIISDTVTADPFPGSEGQVIRYDYDGLTGLLIENRADGTGDNATSGVIVGRTDGLYSTAITGILSYFGPSYMLNPGPSPLDQGFLQNKIRLSAGEFTDGLVLSHNDRDTGHIWFNLGALGALGVMTREGMGLGIDDTGETRPSAMMHIKSGAFTPSDRALLIESNTSGVDTILTALDDGNVGIGTDTPTANLHIEDSLRYVDGNEANGSILKSDANGNASWEVAESFDAADETTATNGTTGFLGTAPLTLTFTPTDTADYLIEWYTEVSTSANGRGAEVRVQFGITSQPLTEIGTHWDRIHFAAGGQLSVSGFKKESLTAGTSYDIDINFRRSNGGAATMSLRRTRIKVTKII